MKKIKVLMSACLLLVVSLAFAVPSWIELSTDAYTSDMTPSTANTVRYAAYYCSVTKAEELFGQGKTSASDMTAYLGGDDYQSGRNWFDANAKQMASATYGRDQYSLISYTEGAFDDDKYIAVVFYDNTAFRAFGLGSAELDSGNVIFDVEAAPSGTVGGWMTVPEPTSGILLLLGVASLALKRKRGKIR